MSEYKSTRNNNSDSSTDSDSTKKVAKTAAKGAGAYFGGAAGAKAVDLASKTKAGDALLNKGADILDKVPGVKSAAEKLDKSGALDKADKALNMANATKGSPGASKANGMKPAGEAKDSAGGGLSSSFSDDKFNSSRKKNKDGEDSSESDSSTDAKGNINVPKMVKISIIVLTPILLILLMVLIIVVAVLGTVSQITDLFGISIEFGLPSGEQTVNASDSGQAFYKRVHSVVDEYSQNNKSVDPLKIVSTYVVINFHDKDYDYDYMTISRIKEIADATIDENGIYSEEIFRSNLKNKIFKKYFPGKSENTREEYVEEVFKIISDYYEAIGYDKQQNCTALGACSYNIKGFYIYGKGNVNKNMNINSLKVRLMESGYASGHDYGGTFGKPLAGEELVDFEKYILGVAYAEIGSGVPDEAIKAQMVAARSYILARPTDMGGWRKIQQENGGYVIQVAASTQDQVYCDPDKGCSGTDGQWGMVHSGLSYAGNYKKNPLPSNSRLRTLANETEGELLVNSQGYVVYAGFTQKEQNIMINLAKQGYNYKQILLNIYNSSTRPLGASDITKMSCNNTAATCANGVTGDYASWKQYKGKWIDTPMGNSGRTIKNIGCLVTSVSMQIARSGVPTNIQGEFNPGTFVEYLNTHGGFASGGNLLWAGPTAAAPRFKFVNKMYVLGYSQQQKLNTLANLLNQGYYVVAEVKGNTGQHWVAVVSVDNGKITMMDPGSESTDMWGRYYWGNTSTFSYFKVV